MSMAIIKCSLSAWDQPEILQANQFEFKDRENRNNISVLWILGFEFYPHHIFELI